MHVKDFGSAQMKIGFIIVAITTLYILSVLALSVLAPRTVQESLVKKGSWIELLTLAAYIAALIYILAREL